MLLLALGAAISCNSGKYPLPAPEKPKPEVPDDNPDDSQEGDKPDDETPDNPPVDVKLMEAFKEDFSEEPANGLTLDSGGKDLRCFPGFPSFTESLSSISARYSSFSVYGLLANACVIKSPVSDEYSFCVPKSSLMASITSGSVAFLAILTIRDSANHLKDSAYSRILASAPTADKKYFFSFLDNCPGICSKMPRTFGASIPAYFDMSLPYNFRMARLIRSTLPKSRVLR